MHVHRQVVVHVRRHRAVVRWIPLLTHVRVQTRSWTHVHLLLLHVCLLHLLLLLQICLLHHIWCLMHLLVEPLLRGTLHWHVVWRRRVALRISQVHAMNSQPQTCWYP